MGGAMDSLLKWSIDATQNPSEAGNPDPNLLAQLLGAPDDLTMMREELRAAVESKDKAERIECLNQFEDHVSHMDNANNMGTLWEPLLHLVNDPDPDISAAAIDCVGTAVQNNDKSQADLVKTKSGIPLLLEKSNSANANVSAKALLALSSAVAHNPAGYDQFVAAKGWEVFRAAFTSNFETDDDRPEKIRGRVLSLLYSLVLLAPEKSVYQELEKFECIPKLESLQHKETGNNKEKIDHIIATLKESPKYEPKMLAAPK